MIVLDLGGRVELCSRRRQVRLVARRFAGPESRARPCISMSR